MSDGVFIPGISNKYNSQSTIEKIMSKKRERLTEFDDDKKQIEEKQKNLGEINGRVIKLDKLARGLIGVANPFDEKIALSSDDNIAVSVNKNADVGEYSMKVNKKAQAHRIASVSFDKQRKIDAGSYKIGSGEKTVSIKFSGGDVEEFRKSINEQGGGVLRASVTYDTTKTAVLILESELSGEKSRISFEDDKTRKLFKELGFYEDIPGFSQEYDLEKSNLVSVDSIVNPMFVENKLELNTNNSFILNLKNSVEYQKSIIIQVDLQEKRKDSEKEPADLNPPNEPVVSRVGDKTIFNIEIPGEEIIHSINPYQAPAKVQSKVNIDSTHLEFVTDIRRIPLGELDVNSEMKTLTFNLDDYLKPGEKLTGIILKNNDTEKKVYAGKVKIYDSETIDGIRFKKELSKAQNADIVFDDLEISRTTNKIDDLLKGVTFNILDKTTGDARIQIDRDYPKMVEKLMDFLQEYNQLIDAINNKTKTVLSDEVKTKDDPEGLGVLRNERELKNLASKLRVIIMNPYETKYGMELSMLSQVGISTNAMEGRASADKLRGLLEYDEDKFVDQFIDVMEKYPEGVKELFGKDVDNDFTYDTGISVEINKLFKGFLEKTRGYFDMRKESYSSDFKKKNEEIDKYKKTLDEEESKLKNQFFRMERSAQELEDNRKKFDNFNKQ
ncbi:MAG: hypothetical protein A2015_08565 [Spirochaetes bacterium GWF1_31_7]|nr:MAG: hypothetical protein A2Y30_07095 [Spirochaetes bacterium GWE1_32_154]OHD47976.1 MAG: hypothetical protein A2015_08565 [Spirochaetes bacterium GWF1_31_7]OHD48067.1 MAG: hypothetical protein A2Y29_07900 [Spirochaetes bacterium GWE2_31_10]OHD81202.1 MAG: hypothetical protein A2355_00345 [Spirochaetes bacterium RIFOXYB1_FULL_32_8]HBD94084.1 hypothetical protein [Spirochaetia bacterium]